MARRLITRVPSAASSASAAAITALMAVILAAVVLFSLRLMSSIEELRTATTRSESLVGAADRILDSLQDAETGQRGFVLTMQPGYLEPFINAGDRLNRALDALDRLVAPTDPIAEHAAGLRSAARLRWAELEQVVFAARTRGQRAAIEMILTNAGKASMEEVRRQEGVVAAAANDERERHAAALVRRERMAIYGLGSAAGIGALLLGFAALRLLLGRQRLHRIQAALQAESARLQGTIDHVRDSVAVFDRAGRLVVWNRTFFRRAGLPEELARCGTPFAQFARAAAGWQPPLLSGPHPRGAPRVAELRQGERVLEVWRSEMPDGGQMVAVADITRRVEAESTAAQAQRLQSLGQLTGGVAHDFNNLLQVISVNLELLEGRLGADPWLLNRLAAARSGVERGARLIRYLLAFARRQPLTPETIAPGDLLLGMEDMLHRTLGARTEVEFVIRDGLWAVRVDPQQLENAVLNLAINARDAMPGGGRLTLEAANLALEEIDAEPFAELLPGDYVSIAVSDTGVGMRPEQVERAVEPFYTTKPAGKGTGLGLSMVYGFARQSGGHLRLSSRLGAGTTAAIIIPRSREAAEAAAAPAPDATQPALAAES